MIRSFKNFAHRLLDRCGYELYKRPYVPKGVDVFQSLRSHWPAWQPETIFDVGANVGQTVARLRPLFPKATILCFEPVPATCTQLRAHVAGDRRVEVLPVALGANSGEATIHLHPFIEQSSMNPDLLANLDPTAPRLQVPVQTITEFCLARSIPRIDLLKIDVEGNELEVLRGAVSLLTAGRIDFIVAEAGLDAGNARFTPLPELCAFLRPHGYWLIGVYEQFGYRFNQSAEFCNVAFALEKHLDRATSATAPCASP